MIAHRMFVYILFIYLFFKHQYSILLDLLTNAFRLVGEKKIEKKLNRNEMRLGDGDIIMMMTTTSWWWWQWWWWWWEKARKSEKEKKIGTFGDRSIGHALMKQNEWKRERWTGRGGGSETDGKRSVRMVLNVLHNIYCCAVAMVVVYELRKLNKGLAL